MASNEGGERGGEVGVTVTVDVAEAVRWCACAFANTWYAIGLDRPLSVVTQSSNVDGYFVLPASPDMGGSRFACGEMAIRRP